MARRRERSRELGVAEAPVPPHDGLALGDRGRHRLEHQPQVELLVAHRPPSRSTALVGRSTVTTAPPPQDGRMLSGARWRMDREPVPEADALEQEQSVVPREPSIHATPERDDVPEADWLEQSVAEPFDDEDR